MVLIKIGVLLRSGRMLLRRRAALRDDKKKTPPAVRRRLAHGESVPRASRGCFVSVPVARSFLARTGGATDVRSAILRALGRRGLGVAPAGRSVLRDRLSRPPAAVAPFAADRGHV